jgi:hypothetical protein
MALAAAVELENNMSLTSKENVESLLATSGNVKLSRPQANPLA